MKTAREWRAEALACYQHDDPIPYDQFIERVQKDAMEAMREAAVAEARKDLDCYRTVQAIRAINIDALLGGDK